MPYKNDLSKNLVELLHSKKTLILIDGANLYFAAQSKRWNIDFKQIYTWFKSKTDLVETVYYTAFNPEDVKQNDFIKGLETSGYRVHKKPIKVFNDSSVKGNLDVEICVDTMKQIFNFEILVLISGDGDFTYLAETLELMGKKVIVIGVGGFMSYELQEQADNYFLLDRIKSVWQKQKKVKEEVATSVNSTTVKTNLTPQLKDNLQQISLAPQPKISPNTNLNSTTKSQPKKLKNSTKLTQNSVNKKQISLDGLEVKNNPNQKPNQPTPNLQKTLKTAKKSPNSVQSSIKSNNQPKPKPIISPKINNNATPSTPEIFL
jgi:uncharacterized protein (TIGR00288 family)